MCPRDVSARCTPETRRLDGFPWVDGRTCQFQVNATATLRRERARAEIGIDEPFADAILTGVAVGACETIEAGQAVELCLTETVSL